MLPSLFDQVAAAAAYIRTLSPLVPRVGIILGSGLGAFAGQVADAVTVPYCDIPHFPQSTVEGHAGKLILGTVAGVPVAVLAGRVHAYEGYSMPQVTFSTRVLGLLGVRTLIVTNAAGGISPDYSAGSLVAIADHINLTGTNAALGPNEPRFALTPPTPAEGNQPAQPTSGLRFFDMTTAYSERLRHLARQAAQAAGFSLPEGIYLAVLGPSYETSAEIRAFRTLGATLVGMSTVHEVIVARHMGMEVLGLSLVTNAAAGISDQTIDHLEVMDIGRQVEPRFAALLSSILPRI